MKKLLTLSLVCLCGFLLIADEILPTMKLKEQETKLMILQQDGTILVGSKNIALCESKMGQELYVQGVSMGETLISLIAKDGSIRKFKVQVFPEYWDTLNAMFQDHPEIAIELQGNRVLLTGETADVNVMRKLKQAVELDKDRIVNLVAYSEKALKALVQAFLIQNEKKDIQVKIIGSEIFLAGQLFDKEQIKNLITEVQSYLKEFSGITVNGSMLQVYKQKILIDIELVSYDESKAKNLGIVIGSPISVRATGTAGMDFAHAGGGEGTGSVSTTFDAQLNLLKQNDAAKKIYATTLSTQSGETAEFQSGGTLYKGVSDLYKTSLDAIEYGYIIKAKPVIIDMETVNLEFSLELVVPRKSGQAAVSSSDMDLSRYTTKSKYIVKPGESILLSGFDDITQEESKTGIPLLSKIPWIGQYLFGNTNTASSNKKIMLMVKTRWEIDSKKDQQALQDLKDKAIEVEMP